MTTGRKIFHHLLVVVLVAVIGVSSGRVAKVVYYYYKYGTAEIDDISGRAEVKDSAGRNFSVVPLWTAEVPRELLPQIAETLDRHAVAHRVVDGKIMVESAKMQLAMDALQAAGLGASAKHFSFREITADPQKEPERYRLQERLATQNMLNNMIALLSDEITACDVRLDSDPPVAQVRLTRKSAGRELAPALLEEIRKTVNAVAGPLPVRITYAPAK